MDKDAVINSRFNKAVEIASKMEALAPDVMLEFYAYYKQATKGDHFSINAYQQDLDVRNSFKFNAWIQLRGITPNEAQKVYIKLVEKYSNQKIV